MDGAFEYREKLKQRTKMYALRIIKLCQSLPKNSVAQVIGWWIPKRVCFPLPSFPIRIK